MASETTADQDEIRLALVCLWAIQEARKQGFEATFHDDESSPVVSFEESQGDYHGEFDVDPETDTRETIAEKFEEIRASMEEDDDDA